MNNNLKSFLIEAKKQTYANSNIKKEFLVDQALTTIIMKRKQMVKILLTMIHILVGQNLWEKKLFTVMILCPNRE